MTNTKAIKEILKEALLVIKDDFALSDVKFHINAAIQKTEHVENKRIKRENVQKQEEIQRQLNSIKQKTQMGLPVNLSKTIGMIDQMIDEEYKKIQKIKLEKIAKENKPNDDIQTIFD